MRHRASQHAFVKKLLPAFPITLLVLTACRPADEQTPVLENMLPTPISESSDGPALDQQDQAGIDESTERDSTDDGSSLPYGSENAQAAPPNGDLISPADHAFIPASASTVITVYESLLTGDFASTLGPISDATLIPDNNSLASDSEAEFESFISELDDGRSEVLITDLRNYPVDLAQWRAIRLMGVHSDRELEIPEFQLTHFGPFASADSALSSMSPEQMIAGTIRRLSENGATQYRLIVRLRSPRDSKTRLAMARLEREIEIDVDGRLDFAFASKDFEQIERDLSEATDDDFKSSASLDPVAELLANRRLAIEMILVDEVKDVEWRWLRNRPFVRVSLDPGDVSGYSRPNDEVDLELIDEDGRSIAIGTAFSNEDGRYTAWLHDDSGRRIRPEPGQVLTIRDEDLYHEIEIGQFDAEWSLDDQLLSGLSEGDSRIQVTLWNPWRPGEAEVPLAQASSSGQWSVEPEYGLYPATHFYVNVQMTSGNDLFYCQQIPMIYLEAGTPDVEIQSLWDGTSRLALQRGAQVIASAEGGSKWSGSPELVLRDEEGRPITPQAGDLLILESLGIRQEFQVGELSSELDMHAMSINGRGMEGTEVMLARPETPMMDTIRSIPAPGEFEISVLDWLDLDGDDLAAESRLDLVSISDEGHLMRQRYFGPKVEIDLSRRRADLQLGQQVADLQLVFYPADASSSLNIEWDLGELIDWLDPNLSHMKSDAGLIPNSRWDFDLPESIDLAVGSRIEIRSGKDQILSTEVPELGLVDPPVQQSLTKDHALQGIGPDEDIVFIEMYLDKDEPIYQYSADTDEAGRWEADLDPRARAGLAAVPLELVTRIDLVWDQPGVRLRKSFDIP